ncbi:MAG: ABC transporter ATP-binding protein [Rhodobacteraceae bacterium]|nr:ABC transporter ATP-binding protein [Paracoccaceae bacterium]
MKDILLDINGLTKAYPGVVANNNVSFQIRPGEVHALLGENGAGKSTLVKMIYGLVKPDSGSMTFQNQQFAPASPNAARGTGVAMVFQHFSLFDALQRVEIIRCLLQNPKLLIMDEPTSVLTPQEVEVLFKTLRKLKSEGTSILYISHKLEEIRALCDTATILRHGEKVDTCIPATTTAREMAEMMVGASFANPIKANREMGDTILSLKNVSASSAGAFGTSLQGISLDLKEGEILGIGGVAGNGQDELLAALSGETTVASEMIIFDGQAIGKQGPTARRKIGLLSAPEERLGHAAAPAMSLRENTVITAAERKSLLKNGFIDWTAADQYTQNIIADFDVRTPGTHTPAGSLSGGNLQKFVVGREVLQNPKVFVVNQPTWGVDAAAAASIRQKLLDLADNGAGVIVISQDLDELLEISDRFCAINEGRLSTIVPTSTLEMDQIGLMMGGATADQEGAYA